MNARPYDWMLRPLQKGTQDEPFLQTGHLEPQQADL